MLSSLMHASTWANRHCNMHCMFLTKSKIKVNSFSSHINPQQHWSLYHWTSARHQLTVWRHKHTANALHSVPVYSPAFTSTHCAYPQWDSQAELTWAAGYTMSWFTHLQTLTHHSTNTPAQCQHCTRTSSHTNLEPAISTTIRDVTDSESAS